MRKQLQELYSQFITNGDLVFLKDPSEQMYEAFRDYVHGTEMLPDNTRYTMILTLLERILDYDFETKEQLKEYEVEISDNCVSIYTRELIEWVSSHLLRVEYCNEAIDLGMNNRNLNMILGCGQYLEYQELFVGLIRYAEVME